MSLFYSEMFSPAHYLRQQRPEYDERIADSVRREPNVARWGDTPTPDNRDEISRQYHQLLNQFVNLRECLYDRVASLKSELAATEESILSSMAAMKADIIKELKPKDAVQEEIIDPFECSICLTDKIDHVLIPCGHSYCESCANKFKKCPACRKHVKKTIKFFI